MVAGRYRLGYRIAAGGAGEVWRAVDTALERPVAVKLLRAEFAGHPETLARFRAEALRAGSLSHPGIAHVYDYGDADPPHPPFLVMEVVDGPSLAGVLAGGPLEVAQTMDVVAQTAASLAAGSQPVTPAGWQLSRPGQSARRWWAEQSRRWREWEHPVSRMALAAAVVFAVGGLVGALLGSQLAGPRPGPQAHPPASSPPAATVDVSAASLAGQPAATVTAQLRSLGLHPHLVWQHTGRQPAGTVVSVQPAGRIPAGSTVTVTAALSPPGHQHHHSDGNGNGGGGGG